MGELADDIESLRFEMAESGQSGCSSPHHKASSLRSTLSEDTGREMDDEVKLQWATIEKLPTFKRLRTSLFDYGDQVDINGKSKGGRIPVDVTKLGAIDRRLFVERLIKNVEEDNRQLLEKLRERFKKVDVKLPTVEVRYKDLCVDARSKVVHGKHLPTLWNTMKTTLKEFMKFCGIKPKQADISILKDVSGIIKPSRMTLLLGPPGCGKTTLLLALSGKLSEPLKVTGEITYNGVELVEFVPQKTSAYISQYDMHIPEMTVRETLNFSARCQGIGNRADMLTEISSREKQADIIPDADIDTYMKAISVKGLQGNLQTDYIMKILGLETCSDIMVGDAMKRGISGGQKKRLTTGEMILGPSSAFFMDEISTGLDSSTTFQIVSCLQQLVHITEKTVLVSLLQPAPETFNLFDDIIIMSEGKIIYHGPRNCVLNFFEDCGFRCPERKSIADFLQEVISRKDQAQYWCHVEKPYSYVTADQFLKKFKTSQIGKKLEEELSKSYDQSQYKTALSFSKYSLKKWELFKTCMEREFLLMKRDSFVYIFKTTQLVIVAIITMSVFIRTRMDVDLVHANYYMGSLFYTIIRLMTNGIAELTLSIYRLQIFYKQRDLLFYPALAYSIPASILKIPISLLESFIWTALTYYVIGYSPEPQRFFCQFLLFFALHQCSTSIYRFLASISQTSVSAVYKGSLTLFIFLLLSGFVISQNSSPYWLKWAFWLSPLTYAEIGLSINEFHAPRWQKMTPENITIGQQVLRNRGLDFKGYFYWISILALFSLTLLFNIGFIMALAYLKRTSQPNIFHEKNYKLQEGGCFDSDKELENKSKVHGIPIEEKKGKVVMPFEPLTIAFQDVQYFIDTPQEMKEQGFTEKRLQLLQDMTGAFRPGILTALMGVSGAGKTTLMDVLFGRKSGGIIEGDIRIGGYPQRQETFARISGYCEQNDVHSPQITVEESVIFSAWLRLPSQIDPRAKAEFVQEVLETIELQKIKDALVGVPGISGLSTEQRKRLTIAVELVANPSIIFMDEPTSGLDARAAAIVMRAVKSIAETGRTIVCTIHQPSIDIFESFDELFLMKRGGQIIYSGPLGQNSSKLIKYFEDVSGVPEIKENYNPATWVLEVTSTSMEQQLGIDFAQIYNGSHLYQDNKKLAEQLSVPPTGLKNLHFESRFPQNGWGQFKACIWKQNLSYWRSPTYNLSRFTFVIISSVLFGALFWQHGRKINNEQDMFNVMGSMYLATVMLGINNCSTVIPIVARERAVYYRERFAGMYTSWAFTLAQLTIEIPYIFIIAAIYVIITYPAIGYYWSAYKVFWYFYTTFSTLLYYNYLGKLAMSLVPTAPVAAILASASYTILSLFSGYLIPRPQIPKWWVWLYWICPTSWTLNAFFTSQYGDITKEIMVFGKPKQTNIFLEEFFGFHHDHLGLVAVALLCFSIAFASAFTYCIEKLNFQRR